MYFGTSQEAFASPCSQHTAIFRHLQGDQKDDLRGSGHGVHPRYRQFYPGERLDNFPLHHVRLMLADSRKSRGNGLVLDQEWVDLSVISRWIDDCSKSHGEQCENPMKIMRAIPDWLVDVKKKCIVEGRESHRYMALSYRLGNAAPFRLTLRDLDVYRKDAILEDAQILELLPLTVRHAILLADRLGCDYLYIEFLHCCTIPSMGQAAISTIC